MLATPTNPLLTIMIPTTVDRREMFKKLYTELWRQVIECWAMNEIEIVYEEDSKEISVGAKRQKLLEKANGEFVVGFDSDDWPAPNYINDILQALLQNKDIDHVGFFELCTWDGKNPKISIFSNKYQKWGENIYGYDYIRCANPKSVIRKSKALQVGFADQRFGEDILFSEAVTPLLKSEVFIDKILYYYKYKTQNHDERYGIK